MSLRVKVTTALDRIGKLNGTAPPSSQDPLNEPMHEYLIASTMASYADARKKAARRVLDDALSTDQLDHIEGVKTTTAKKGIGNTVTIALSSDYQLVVTSKRGAEFLDTKKLENELRRIMPGNEVDALFDKCRFNRTPSVSYNIVERADNE